MGKKGGNQEFYLYATDKAWEGRQLEWKEEL